MTVDASFAAAGEEPAAYEGYRDVGALPPHDARALTQPLPAVSVLAQRPSGHEPLAHAPAVAASNVVAPSLADAGALAADTAVEGDVAFGRRSRRGDCRIRPTLRGPDQLLVDSVGQWRRRGQRRESWKIPGRNLDGRFHGDGSAAGSGPRGGPRKCCTSF